MEFIDLHVHTTASDGTKTPSEIVDMALEVGLSVIAITDHDTVAGVDEAISAAEGRPLKVVPGVELTSVFNGRDVHVLGYNIDHHNRFLLDTLKHVDEIRNERNVKMVERLQDKGIDITMEELITEQPNSTITRGDMGRMLVRKGYAGTVQEAFDRYLSSHAKESCFVPRFKMPLEDVYKLITFAGGICSIAHPVQYKLTDSQYRDLFMTAKNIGFKCIEAIHSDNGANDQDKYTAYAREFRMAITGGSDYHGVSKPDIMIGTGRGNIKVPKSILNNIRNL